MSIRSDLRKYLSEQDTIIPVVASRIYPILRPQDDALPALTYTRMTGGHGHNLKQSSGWAIATFEIECLAETYAAADALAEIVRQKMQGFSGLMGTTKVQSAILDDESDSIEAPEDDSDEVVFIITLYYRILHTESVPAL